MYLINQLLNDLLRMTCIQVKTDMCTIPRLEKHKNCSFRLKFRQDIILIYLDTLRQKRYMHVAYQGDRGAVEVTEAAGAARKMISLPPKKSYFFRSSQVPDVILVE